MNLSYTILGHMLSTPVVTNWSLPYDSITTKILRHFHVPLTEPIYTKIKKLGREIIYGIGFSRRRSDDKVLNNVYLEDQLPNFRLGARPRAPCRATVA